MECVECLNRWHPSHRYSRLENEFCSVHGDSATSHQRRTRDIRMFVLVAMRLKMKHDCELLLFIAFPRTRERTEVKSYVPAAYRREKDQRRSVIVQKSQRIAYTILNNLYSTIYLYIFIYSSCDVFVRCVFPSIPLRTRSPALVRVRRYAIAADEASVVARQCPWASVVIPSAQMYRLSS